MTETLSKFDQVICAWSLKHGVAMTEKALEELRESCDELHHSLVGDLEDEIQMLQDEKK